MTRLSNNAAILVHHSEVPHRWFKSYAIGKQAEIAHQSNALASYKNTSVLSTTEKFNEVLPVRKNAADYMSLLGMKEFSEKLEQLNLLFSMWLSNKQSIVIEQSILMNSTSQLITATSADRSTYTDSSDKKFTDEVITFMLMTYIIMVEEKR